MRNIFLVLVLLYAGSTWGIAPGANLSVKRFEICRESVSSPFLGKDFELSLGWVQLENKLPFRTPTPERGLFGEWDTGVLFKAFPGWNDPRPPSVDPWGRQWFECDESSDTWSVVTASGISWELCRVEQDTTGLMKLPRYPRYQLLKNGVRLTEFVAALSTRTAISAAWVHGETCVVEYRFSSYEDTPSQSSRVSYHLLVNGEDLNGPMRFSDAYHANILGERLFFFFERNGQRGWWYDGVETVTDYDLFFHDQSSSPGMWNPYFFDDGFELFARRNSIWYLVRATTLTN
jgi:hypothetical protein